MPTRRLGGGREGEGRALKMHGGGPQVACAWADERKGLVPDIHTPASSPLQVSCCTTTTSPRLLSWSFKTSALFL